MANCIINLRTRGQVPATLPSRVSIYYMYSCCFVISTRNIVTLFSTCIKRLSQLKSILWTDFQLFTRGSQNSTSLNFSHHPTGHLLPIEKATKREIQARNLGISFSFLTLNEFFMVEIVASFDSTYICI